MAKLKLSDFIDLAEGESETVTTYISTGKAVPNVHPTLSAPYRIALIGEAPGEDEEKLGVPFVGRSGRHLNQVLSRVGIMRDACFVGNVCQHRPPGNNLSLFSREGSQIKDGLTKLEEQLAEYMPNICVLLGKTALWAFAGREDISNYRGTLFQSTRGGYKCIASWHPAACLRVYPWTFDLSKDLQKAKRHALQPSLVLPERDLVINLSIDQLLYELDVIIRDKPKIWPDIEGYWNRLECCSIATSPSRAILVPFTLLSGGAAWVHPEDEILLWQKFAQIMCDPRIPKCWQNGLYDRFALHYGYGIMPQGNVDDQMLKWWELYAEMDKNLAYQVSILTDEPFYKSDRKTTDRETHHRYCCKDGCVTCELDLKCTPLLNKDQLFHYNLNTILLNPLLYMELRGIRYDKEKARARHKEVLSHIYNLQADLDEQAGVGLSINESRQSCLQRVCDSICFKRDVSKPKKGYEEIFKWASTLLMGSEPLTKTHIGRLNIECGLGVNVDSSKQVQNFLYDTLGLPIQFNDDSPTADIDALLKLKKGVAFGSKEDLILDLVIELGRFLTRRGLLEAEVDRDGRMRTGYNLVGSETARITSSKSPTGSGFNLQTVTKGITTKPIGHPLKLGMRDLFLADEGYHLFQCDLSGSDGWTIGAYMAMLGDPTMIEDLRAGIKPAAVVCYMLRHGTSSLHGKTRPEIKELLREVKSEDHDYFSCKQGIWGICYTMGPDRLATVIAKKSDGMVWKTRDEINALRNAVYARYNVKRWHNWMADHLKRNHNTLKAPNGFQRHFYGQPREILGEALAHLPQVITTYATNLATFRLWTDTENRVSAPSTAYNEARKYQAERGRELSGDQPEEANPIENRMATRLRVEPLHTVHDALIGQFKIDDTPWAVRKIREWFYNPITIAGQTIVIPFEGHYGDSWGSLDAGTI